MDSRDRERMEEVDARLDSLRPPQPFRNKRVKDGAKRYVRSPKQTTNLLLGACSCHTDPLNDKPLICPRCHGAILTLAERRTP